MLRDPQPWTPPITVRALMWWPPTAMLLVTVAPDSAAWSIALAGGVLALLGTFADAARRVAARRARALALGPERSPVAVDTLSDRRAA